MKDDTYLPVIIMYLWMMAFHFSNVIRNDSPSQYEIDHPVYSNIDGPIDLEKTKQMVSDGIEAFDELWNQGE